MKDARMQSISDLLVKITNFVDQYVPNTTDGWTPVSAEDRQTFKEIVLALRDLKWADDLDRDPTLEIKVIDRQHEFHPFRSLPYDHQHPSKFARLAILNLQIAAHQSKRILRALSPSEDWIGEAAREIADANPEGLWSVSDFEEVIMRFFEGTHGKRVR